MNIEQLALTGDNNAIIRVVSSLRKYRKAALEMLDSLNRDGTCNWAEINIFKYRREEAEQDLLNKVD